jgi:hypothetical protein
MANDVGRPRTFTDEQVAEIRDKLVQYIATTEIPIVAEFEYLNDIIRQILYDYPEFSTLTKKLIAKKEAQLERKGLMNEVNSTMAIFSLKQLGWRDKQEIETKSSDQDKMVNTIKELFSK